MKSASQTEIKNSLQNSGDAKLDPKKKNIIMRAVGAFLSLMLLLTIYLDYEKVIFADWANNEDVVSDYNIIKYLILAFSIISLIFCAFGNWNSIKIVGICGLTLCACYLIFFYGYSQKFENTFSQYLGIFRLGSYLLLICPLAILVLAILMSKEEQSKKKA